MVEREQDRLRRVLELAEGSGRVEFKRNCSWPIVEHPGSIQKLLMRIANANPSVGGFIELGRENDGTRVGLVDEYLNPMSEKDLGTAEQRLAQIAGKLDPPMQVRWYRFTDKSVSTIVIEVPGRIPGRWYQGENGTVYTGSASHPIVAPSSLLQQWAHEASSDQMAMLSRPIFSLRCEWIPPYQVQAYDEYQRPIRGKMDEIPGQIIARVFHETGGTGFDTHVFLESDDYGEIELDPDKGRTIRPTAIAAVYPQTRSTDGEVTLVAFRKSDKRLVVGSNWRFATLTRDDHDNRWRQESKAICLPDRLPNTSTDSRQDMHVDLLMPAKAHA